MRSIAVMAAPSPHLPRLATGGRHRRAVLHLSPLQQNQRGRVLSGLTLKTAFAAAVLSSLVEDFTSGLQEPVIQK
jgi:hypothetical protein